MSKYQELHKAFVSDMSRHYENTNACFGFVHEVVRRMVYSLNWNNDVEYVALKEPINYKNLTPISFNPEDSFKDKLGNLAYLVDGSFWHFGVRLTLMCNQVAGRHKEIKFIIP